ncbi:MAG: antibiotic biosynthesis monooxygenase family protein [Candidatus Thorarchaeota archaeon]
MFARLGSAQVSIDKLDKGITIWKEKDMPPMDSVEGYLGAYLLTDRKTGKVISMTLWNSEEDAIADEQSNLHKNQVDMYKDILIGDPVFQRYEVSAQHKV